MRLRTLFSFALFISLSVGGSAAFAQEEDSAHEEALRLFQLGELHYEGGEFGQAAQSFSRAYELEPNAILALNAALAYENAGQLEQARTYFEYVVELEPDGDMAEQAERGLARIGAILESLQEQRAMEPGRLILTSNPEAAVVMVDGMTVGETPYEEVISPGTHDLRVELEGYTAYEDTVEVGPSESVRIVVPLTPLVPEQAEVAEGETEGDGSETDEDLTEEVDRGSINLVPFYILTGVSALGVTGGVIFAMQAQSRADELESDADVLRSDSVFSSTVDEGKTAQLLSTISYGVAGASAIGAVVYLIVARPRSETTDEGAQVRISPWLTGAGATVDVQF